MKLSIVVCITVCVILLASASRMPAAKASIASYNWIGALTRNSFDSFYGTSITAYAEETPALLVVNVYNDYYRAVPMNVSAVKVGFDWGVNYTSSDSSTASPFSISFSQSHVFAVNFTVPSASLASNLVTHSYNIYVEHVNSTTGNKEIVGTSTQSGFGFVVFSSDQADAYSFNKQLQAYPTTSSIGLPLITATARQLVVQSNVAKTLASDAYTRGDFGTARQQYQVALQTIQEAWANETDEFSTFENSFAHLLNGGGDMLTFQGYAWLLFGVGFIMISVGALVYLLRKRPQPRTMTQPPQ